MNPKSLNIIPTDTPENPDKAVNADTANPGDRTQQSQQEPIQSSTSEEGTQSVQDEEETQTHWVEIKLEDDEGNPVPLEPYEVHLSDGEVIKGTLDENGEAKVEEIEESGNCEITFPRIHRNEWESK